MSSQERHDPSPVTIAEDRYSGVYSGGKWLTIAQSDRAFEGQSRADWVEDNGPGSDDVTAAMFWARPPSWIATGATPEDAIQHLYRGFDPAENWQPPSIEDDPRYRAKWR